MSQDVNLVIEQFSTFDKVLKFKKKKTEDTQRSAITGQPVCVGTLYEPVDITGFTFSSVVRKEYSSDSEKILDFEMNVVDGTGGLLSMVVDAANTVDLDDHAVEPDVPPFNYDGQSKILFLGYYDIVSKSPEGIIDRVFKGKVYLSKGITVDPSVLTP